MVEIVPNLHPVFVHFTVALTLISVGLFIISYSFKDKKYFNLFINTAYVNLWLGSLLSVITVAMGFYAYYTVSHDSPSHLAMTDHRNWAIITFLSLAILSIFSVRNYLKNNHHNSLFILLSIITAILILTTSYKGGEVVYRYGIGVMSLPKTQGDGGHGSHSHGNTVNKKMKQDNHSNHKH